MVSFIPTDGNDLDATGNPNSSAIVEIISSGQVLHIKVVENIDLESRGFVAVAVDDQVRRHGRVCVLFELHDRDGPKAMAMWQDKTSNFKVQSVDHTRLDDAKAWLKQHIAR